MAFSVRGDRHPCLQELGIRGDRPCIIAGSGRREADHRALQAERAQLLTDIAESEGIPVFIAVRVILESSLLEVLDDRAVLDRDLRRDRIAEYLGPTILAPVIKEELIESMSGFRNVDRARRGPFLRVGLLIRHHRKWRDQREQHGNRRCEYNVLAAPLQLDSTVTPAGCEFRHT